MSRRPRNAVTPARAASRSSANYSVPADTQDAGGRRATSASYSNSGCVGGVAGLGAVAAPAETAKHGYLGQLYDVKSLQLSANPTNVNEAKVGGRGTARQRSRFVSRSTGGRVRWHPEPLVTEQTLAGEDHGDVVLVRGGDHFGVAH